MASKRKLHHLHKVKIHHNRWLIWAIAYAVIVAIALVGYIKVTDTNLEAEPQSVYESWRSYKNNTLKFVVRYPSTWAIEAESNSSVSFLPNENSDSGVSISVLPMSAESSIRRTLDIDKELIITLDNTPATKIDTNSGESVIFSKYRNQLYVIRGSAGHVDRIAKTFYFVK